MVHKYLWMIVVVFAAFLYTAQSAQGSVFDEMIRYQPQVNIIGYPPISDVNGPFSEGSSQPLHYIRMMGFGSDGTLTQAKADALAKQRANEGFNCLIAEGTRYVFRDLEEEHIPSVSASPVFTKVLSDCTLASKACHQYGLTYFLHVTCSMVTPGVLEKHPDWAVLNFVTGKPVVNGYGMMQACINNDDFMKTFFERIERLIRETDADGIMMDEIQYFTPNECGCMACREKFQRETDYEIPADVSGWLGNYKDLSYVKWLDWRREKVAQRMRQTTDLIKKYGRDKINITYSCQASAGYGYYGGGWVIDDAIKYADYVGYENEPQENNYYNYWPQTFAEAKYVQAVAEKTSHPMWTLWYNRRGGDCVWNWITSLTLGSSSWIIDYPNLVTSWPPQLAWEKQHAKLLGNTTPAANVGVYFSLSSRDHDTRAKNDPMGLSWIHGFFATSYALTDGHIPYRVILSEYLTQSELSGIHTLFLLDTCAMSDKQISTVKEFVRNGGVLVASGDIAKLDENGQDSNNLRLADVLGFKFGSQVKGPAYLSVEDPCGVLGGLTGTFLHGSNFSKITNVENSARIIGKFAASDGVAYPGIIVNQYSKGRVIYFAGHPERHYLFSYYNLPIITPGKYWADKRMPAYANMLCRAAQYENESMPLITTNIPKGVVAEAYHHQAEGLKGIKVHLANFLGPKVSDGQVPLYSDVSFPEVKAYLPNPYLPMQLAVCSSDVKKVFMVSPDFNEVVSLPFIKAGKYTVVDIPGLYRYAMVYFAEKAAPALLDKINQQSVSSLPGPKALLTQVHRPLIDRYIPGSITLFADSENTRGAANHGLYMGENGMYLYGTESPYSNAAITMDVPDVLAKATLEVGGIESGTAEQVNVRISINGCEIYDGHSGFGHNVWSVKAFDIPAGILKKGTNTVTFCILDKGPGSGPPWLGINYIRLMSDSTSKQ